MSASTLPQAAANPSTSALLSAVLTPSGEGRVFDAGDHWGRIAISSEQSGGAFSLFTMEVAAQGGPPPHVHTLEDETFHIHKGRFEFWVDGETICAGPGDTVFAPRHIPHTWRCISDEGGRAMVLVTPGENFESFFLEMSARGLLAEPPSPKAIATLCSLAERHGLRMLPPGECA
jgi:quercetin dioxygenase-like cupin family protein